MLKKIAVFWVLLLFAVPLVQAETYIYGGAQVIVPGGGKTDEVGGGMMFGLGQKIGKNLIFWGNYEGIKTGEADEQDNGYAGLEILSDPIISSGALQGGLFLLVEGGLQNAPNSPVNFGSLINGGLWFKLSETAELRVGGGYSGDLYSIDIGTVIRFWE